MCVGKNTMYKFGKYMIYHASADLHIHIQNIQYIEYYNFEYYNIILQFSHLHILGPIEREVAD